MLPCVLWDDEQRPQASRRDAGSIPPVCDKSKMSPDIARYLPGRRDGTSLPLVENCFATFSVGEPPGAAVGRSVNYFLNLGGLCSLLCTPCGEVNGRHGKKCFQR